MANRTLMNRLHQICARQGRFALSYHSTRYESTIAQAGTCRSRSAYPLLFTECMEVVMPRRILILINVVLAAALSVFPQDKPFHRLDGSMIKPSESSHHCRSRALLR